MPAASNAIGACSRDEPQPKFLPATMTLYGETNSSSVWNGTWPLGSPDCAGGTLPSAYLPNCLYSSGTAGLNVRYCAGMIWSVSTLSPKTYALPVMVDCMRVVFSIDSKRLVYIASLGSVITPVIALAATVSGLARYTRASLWPMRPGKFRLVVLMQLIGAFKRPNVSLGPPKHAAQDGWPILAPAERNTSSSDWPFRLSCLRPVAVSLVAGTMNVSILTDLPLSRRAAARKSVILPPVQEPMYARSSLVPRISETNAR